MSERRLSSLPCWSLGLDVKLTRLSRCMWMRQRWMRAGPDLGTGVAYAFNAVADEHVGRVTCLNSVWQAAVLSRLHAAGRALAVPPSIATSRHQPFMQVPSAMTVCCTTPSGWMRGLRSQHQSTRLLKLRELSVHLHWGDNSSSHSRNSSRWNRLCLASLRAPAFRQHRPQCRLCQPIQSCPFLRCLYSLSCGRYGVVQKYWTL